MLQAAEEQRVAHEKAIQQAKREAFLTKAQEYKQKKSQRGDDNLKHTLKRTFAEKANRAEDEAKLASASKPPQPPPLVHLLSLGKTISKPQPPSQRPCEEDDDEVQGGLPHLPPPPSFHTMVLQSLQDEDADAISADGLIDGDDIKLDFATTVKLDDNQSASETNDDGDDDLEMDIIEWVYVDDNKEPAYYWNMITNETTYEQPADFDGLVYSEEVLKAFQQQYAKIIGEYDGGNAVNAILPNVSEMWQVGLTEDKEHYYYYNMQTEETTYERPDGTLYISCVDDSNNEYHWQECYDEEGNAYYYSMSTEESQWDLPIGTMYIILSAQ